jgi:hypothetical protein
MDRFFLMARQPLGGLGRLSFQGFTITHFVDTPRSVGLLWTRDQLVAETSKWTGIPKLIGAFWNCFAKQNEEYNYQYKI